MKATSRPVFEFGDFRLDPAERLLIRGDQAIDVAPKTLDVLVERHGHPGDIAH